MIIDAHGHFLPSSMIEALRQEKRLFPSVKTTDTGGGVRFSFRDGDPTRPVTAALSDVEKRCHWLATQGIDRQVVGGWLDIFGYELAPEEGTDWCRFMNEHMLAAAGESGIFAPLACVPLQNGKFAARVLEEALDRGFNGVMIGTQPAGAGGELDSADLNPFWELLSARKATALVHPMLVCCEPRLRDYDLVNIVGRIMDTTAAISRLMFSGHLRRFPDCNILVSHGGAALPYLLGRLERGGSLHAGKYADPVEAFRRLYFDSVLFDVRALRFLCEMAGADKVCMGSDHPFLLGDAKPLELIEKAGLCSTSQTNILGDTAMRIFNMKHS